MLKEKSDTSFHEEAAVRPSRWAQVCRVLWKIIAVLGTAVLLSALASIIATWLTSSKGMIPADSPLWQLLAAWPITLSAGCCLCLLATLIGVLSRRHTHETISLSEQNRIRMLQRLEHTYRKLLEQSLEGAAWVELGLTQKPDAVLTTAHLLLRLPDQPERDLPPGTSILRVYRQVQGELLVLGQPGAGKSTLLLSLAQQLVEEAEDDTSLPLPVILPLSSWAIKRQPLQDWCSKQIAQIYNAPRQVCEQWMQHDQILLLLDGLDEMEEETRPACIAAINTYHHEHMMPLVVCSREAEYTDASKHQRLALEGAVIVRSLTKEQVDRHLAQVGAPVAALRKALKSNPALQELATTPLMLNVLMLTYQGTPARNLPTKGATLQQQVLDNYVQRMVERKGNSKLYPLERTRQWLGWLAFQLRGHKQTIFYPERLQPDWLPAEQQRLYTWLAVRLPSALIGVLAGLLTAPLLITFDLGLLLQYSILSGFLGALFSVPKAHAPTQGAQYRFRMITGRLTTMHFAASAVLGLVWGAVFMLNMHSGDTSDSWPLQCIYSSASGVTIGLSCLLLMILLPQAAPKQILAIPQNKGWWSRLRHIVSLHGRRALLAAIIFGIGISLSDALSAGLSAGLSNGLSVGLSVGLLSVMVSVIHGTLAEDIHSVERLKWTRRSLLRSLFISKHLRSTLVLIFVSLVLFGLSQGLGPWLDQGLSQGLSWGLSWGLSQGLGWGLSWGLSCWFLLGLFQGISHQQVEDQDRHLFNQGIRDSLRNSAFMSIISAILIGVISVLSWGLSYELSYGLNYGLNWGLSYELSYELGYGLNTGLNQGLSHAWLFAVSGGLLIGTALSGGLAALRHYVLRFLLWRAHTFPWKAQLFLEDAGRRNLLRCVDGKYSFTHRLLLDYLADCMASAREKGLPIGEGRNEKAVLIGKGSHQSMENVMNVDIGIITVRDDELQAVLQRFRTKRQRIPGRQSYYISHVTAKDGKHYTIAITRCSEQGNDLSQKLAKSMILDLQPQIILVVGIAGGMPSDEFTLGDVIVSSRILNFNVDAQKGGGVTYVTRGSSHALIENITGLLPGERLLLGWNKQDSIGLERPDVDLQQVKIEGGDADWQQKIQKSLDWHFAREQNRRRPPLFKSGHIASSNHLARDPSVVNQWLSMNRAILATEMESAGVCEAANDINYHYPVMAIRGISDIIGLERDGRWTAYACHTAAAFTKAFIKAGIIEPQTNLVDLQQSNTFSEPSSISSVILNQQPVHQTISMQDNSGPPISSAGTPHIISIREQIIHAPLEGAKALSDYLAAHPMKGAQKQTEVDLKRSQLEDIERSYRLLGPEVDKKAEKNRIILSLLQLCLEIEQSE